MRLFLCACRRGLALPRAFICLLTKETKTAGARLLADLLVFDG
jgi:hypothetical protein